MIVRHTLYDAFLIEDGETRLAIGGLGGSARTTDTDDALEAVSIIALRLVIPCHYSVPFFWKRRMDPANEQEFKRGVKKEGIECRAMRLGEAIAIGGESFKNSEA